MFAPKRCSAAPTHHRGWPSSLVEFGGVSVFFGLLEARYLCAFDQALGAPDDFVLNYCMEPEHYDWCITAKEVVTSWEGGGL